MHYMVAVILWCLDIGPAGLFVSGMDVRNAEKHAAGKFLCLIIDNELSSV